MNHLMRHVEMVECRSIHRFVIFKDKVIQKNIQFVQVKSLPLSHHPTRMSDSKR